MTRVDQVVSIRILTINTFLSLGALDITIEGDHDFMVFGDLLSDDLLCGAGGEDG